LTLGEPAGIGPDLALAVWRRRRELDVPAFYLSRISLKAARARLASMCRSPR
jgi:4-hydroxythreonine-4-phosphate dehydrogenase